jgi:hydrogenase maturation protein HypF
VRQPWRSGLAYFHAAFGDAPPNARLFKGVAPTQLRVVDAMIARRVQTVDTSSCGRLFDAVSSLLGIRHETSYEGQAAIELEAAATDAKGAYSFGIESGEPFQIDLRPAIAAIVHETLGGIPAGDISARFHRTVSDAIVAGCERIRAASGLQRVCLSGGTFQNLRLLRHAVTGLRTRGFEVLVHRRVPANDGGLALGQAVIAAHRVRDNIDV